MAAYMVLVIRPWIRSNAENMFQSWRGFIRGFISISILFGVVFGIIFFIEILVTNVFPEFSGEVLFSQLGIRMPIIGALTKVQLLNFSEILALTIVAMATTYFVVKPLLYAFFKDFPLLRRRACLPSSTADFPHREGDCCISY